MEGFEGGSDCFWVAWAFVLDFRVLVGFGFLILKVTDVVVEKMVV